MKFLKFVAKVVTLVGVGYVLVKKFLPKVVVNNTTHTDTFMGSNCFVFGDEEDYES